MKKTVGDQGSEAWITNKDNGDTAHIYAGALPPHDSAVVQVDQDMQESHEAARLGKVTFGPAVKLRPFSSGTDLACGAFTGTIPTSTQKMYVNDIGLVMPADTSRVEVIVRVDSTYGTMPEGTVATIQDILSYAVSTHPG